MPFTAHDLRYNLQDNYPKFAAYLQQRAQRHLGQLAYDPNEVDLVVGHVVEQLARLGLLGGGDDSPESTLDRLSNAQFYAFLNQSVKNKAIDRLRKRRLPISTSAELQASVGTEVENDPLNEYAESLWGAPPFATPEEEVLSSVSQQELRDLLKNSIRALSSEPRQLQAVLRELEEVGATELLKDLLEEFKDSSFATYNQLYDYSRDKELAHNKLRQLLQKGSDILINKIASRLVVQKPRLINDDKVLVTIPDLAQEDLSIRDVRTGLRQLTTEGFLNWNDEETFYITQAQIRRLKRLFKL